MITSKRKNKTVDIIDFVTTTMIMITSKPKNKTVGIIDFVTTTTIFAPQDKNTCTPLHPLIILKSEKSQFITLVPIDSS